MIGSPCFLSMQRQVGFWKSESMVDPRGVYHVPSFEYSVIIVHLVAVASCMYVVRCHLRNSCWL
jgi:hypothetical protein